MGCLRLITAVVTAGLAFPGAVSGFAQPGLWFPNYDVGKRSVGITKYAFDGTVIVDVALPAGAVVGYSAAVDYARNVWYSDNAGRLFQISPTGSILRTVSVGPTPQGLAVDAQDNVFVVGRTPRTITKYSPTGTALATNRTPKGAIAAVVDKTGDVWVPAFDIGSGNPFEIYRYTNNLSTFALFTYTPPSTGPFGMSGIATDLNGDIYVVNQARSSVMKLNAAGAVQWETVLPHGYGRGVAADASGYVWVAGHLGRHVYKLRAGDGTILSSFAPPSRAPLAGVYIDGNGDVWSLGNMSPVINKWHRGDGTNTVQANQRRGSTVAVGDASGFHSAVFLHPTKDLDGDTFPNAAEAMAGSNYLDPQSTPKNPKPIASGPFRGGTTLYITMRHKPSAGLAYLLAFSLGTSPGIPVPGVGTIPLTPDALFFLSLTLGPPLFVNTQGVLDADGDALAQIKPPAGLPSGLTVYCAFVTVGAGGIQTISNALALTSQ